MAWLIFSFFSYDVNTINISVLYYLLSSKMINERSPQYKLPDLMVTDVPAHYRSQRLEQL